MGVVLLRVLKVKDTEDDSESGFYLLVLFDTKSLHFS